VYCFTHKGDKKTKYLLTLDFDENDEVTPRFTPIAEHYQPKEPLFVPADVLGAAREAAQSMWEKLGTMSFNDGLALMERETRRLCRLIAGSRIMSLMRRRPVYRPPVSRVSPRRARIRAPRRSRRSVAVASRGEGDDGGGGDPDPPRPRLTPVLGTVTFFPSQHRNSKAPWRRRRPGPCCMARYLRPVPRSRHGCLDPP